MPTPAIVRLLIALAVVTAFGVALPQRISDMEARRSGAGCQTAGDESAGVTAGDIVRYEACLDIDPSNEGLVASLGAFYEKGGDGARAERVYRRSLAVDPFFAPARVRLGWLLLGRGDARGARAAADEALATLLNDPSALALRERALARMGQAATP
jgi:tetratricopeptide (TPR) repeat protein